MTHTKRFDTIFLHIGLGKTGSTYIQEDIVSKTNLLETKYNLHYPKEFPHEPLLEGNHSLLLRTMFSDTPAVRRRLLASGLRNPEEIESYNQKTLKQLHRGFSESKASRVLLSAEGVSNFGRLPLHQLADWLQSLAHEVKIIACVRDPVKVLSSVIQQRLTTGGVLEDLYKNPPFHRFEGLFSRVEKAFGEENLTVYNFEDAVSSPLGLTGYFLSIIGLDPGTNFPKKPPVNSSMSHEAALLLSQFNKLYPTIVDGKANSQRQDVPLTYFKKIPGRKFSAPKDVHDLVRGQIQPDLEWLKRRHRIEFNSVYPEDIKVADSSFSVKTIEHLAKMIAENARSECAVVADISTKKDISPKLSRHLERFKRGKSAP